MSYILKLIKINLNYLIPKRTKDHCFILCEEGNVINKLKSASFLVHGGNQIFIQMSLQIKLCLMKLSDTFQHFKYNVS